MEERKYSYLGSKWRWAISFKFWLLYPLKKSQWSLLDKRFGGLQTWAL
jgi:hypothetical protein